VDGANGNDIIGEFSDSASRSSRRERYNPLIRPVKKQRQQRFYRAVAEPSLPPRNPLPADQPGAHRQGRSPDRQRHHPYAEDRVPPAGDLPVPPAVLHDADGWISLRGTDYAIQFGVHFYPKKRYI
jgi:hypothetical protein